MFYISPIWWVVAVSELVALAVIVRIWRSREFLVLKVLLSAIALVPVLGPLLALWIGAFPNEARESVQDRGSRGDYYRDWSPVFGAQNPIRRFRQWRAQVAVDEESDP
jgi:hypothetical protein